MSLTYTILKLAAGNLTSTPQLQSNVSECSPLKIWHVHQSINHDRKMQRDIKFELTCHWSKCFCCVPTRLLEVASSIKMSCFKRGTEAVLRRAQSHNITAVSNIASQWLVAHPASQRAVAHPLKNEWPFKMDGRLPFLSRSEMHTANRDHKEVTRRSFRHHN